MPSAPSSSDAAITTSAGASDGRPMVLDFGDPAGEYAALRTGALLVDHGDRDVWIVQGPQARETLAGLVTNDVVSLTPGHGVYAAALTPKGRIIADLRAYALADDSLAPSAPRTTRSDFALATATSDDGWPSTGALLVDVPGRAADGWAVVVRKYVNPRLATYRRVGAHVRAVGAYGVRARDAVAEAFALPPSALAALAAHGHATVETREGPIVIARVPDLAMDGFVIYAALAAYDTVWSHLARAHGVTAGGQRAYDVARIEAGRPAWGIDIDESTIPQEANLDDHHAISYTKGCYTGQEVVARVHFRGRVNRHLRGLTYSPDGGTLTTGARLIDEEGRDVGDVRSVALSPRLGGVALAMVRREVPLGATLVARTLDERVAADAATPIVTLASAFGTPTPDDRVVAVTELPFPG